MRWSVTSPLRVALLDDHPLIREALKIRLALEADFKVTGIYASSRDLIEGLRANSTDLLILDYKLTKGEVDGLRLIQIIRNHHCDLRIIVFSSVEQTATASMCIRAGANGFVGKSQDTDELLRAIRVVASNRVYLTSSIVEGLNKLPAPDLTGKDPIFDGDQALASYFELSPREREVLRCFLDGLSVAQVAIKFARSNKTISAQKQAAFRKLGVRSDTELFKLQAHLIHF